MNKLAFLLLIFPAIAFSQSGPISYYIDYGRRDSFYLVTLETINKSARPDSVVLGTLMRDTSQYRKFVNDKALELDRARQLLAQYEQQCQNLSAQIQQLRDLGAKTFGMYFPDQYLGTDIRAPDVLEIIPIEPAPAGFWIIYPKKGTTVQYLTDFNQIKKRGSGTILNCNGTTMEVKNGKYE